MSDSIDRRSILGYALTGTVASTLGAAAPARAQRTEEENWAKTAARADEEIANTKRRYSENWASLADHDEAPAWFQDAKFGIYTHWGPCSVGNIGIAREAGWYGMQMYQNPMYDWQTGEPKLDKNGKPIPHPAYLHHVKTFGDPKTHGYTEVIKAFKPTRFNAAEWAELFKESGARFSGPVGMHHDNYAMWDSKVTRWNVKKTAGIDVAGELKREIEKRGMKYIISFHHAFTWVFFANAWNYDATEATSDLYTDRHALTDFKVTPRFMKEWWAKLKEVIDNYQPDVIWFDWWVEGLPEDYRKKFLAYYFNKGEEWGKDVVVSYKNTSFPTEVGVHDYERGRPNVLKEEFWMTDTSPGAWFFTQNAKFVTTNEIVDILVDIVSKNGLMLLNVPPDPDGSIPPEMKKMLREIGAWLKLNGEGIYETRPFGVYGEGPTRIRAGGHKVEAQKIVYTENDIRFTRKGDDTVFAFAMAPPTKDIRIATLGKNMTALSGPISKITMLGSEEPIRWEHRDDALIIRKPARFPSDMAVGFKLELNVAAEIGIGGDQA